MNNMHIKNNQSNQLTQKQSEIKRGMCMTNNTTADHTMMNNNCL